MAYGSTYGNMERSLAEAIADELANRNRIRTSFTDHSGTITSPAVSIPLMSANPDRQYLLVQNPINLQSADLWINFGSTATDSQPSIQIRPGEKLVFEGTSAPIEFITIFGVIKGQQYIAKQK
jgi:hypothetical protein